jgi:hypothetical protein
MNRNTHTTTRRAFYDGPTIRVAVWILNNADDNVVSVVDQDAAAACSVSVRDYRSILRRLDAAGMITRTLHEPGSRGAERTITIQPEAFAWLGVTGWINLRTAEDFVSAIGVRAGRTIGGGQ